MTIKKNALLELQARKVEVALKCREKAEEIERQTNYITEHLGEIAIKGAIKSMLKKDSESKTGIVKLLVTEGLRWVFTEKKETEERKDKIATFFNESISGLLNLIFKKR